MKPVFLILGSDHFNNPDNGDLSVPKTTGILAGKRQNELEDVVDRLKTFHPTKIALEVLMDNQGEWNKDYHAYLSGAFTLTANERHQIGFRTAGVMGHNEIYAVDWNQDVPDTDYIEWARKHDPTAFETVISTAERWTHEMEDYFSKHTIREYLLMLNQPDWIKENRELYMKVAAIGDDRNPIGARWTAQYWYYRNMIIYKNLTELAWKNERILVIYGAGHVHLLTQFLKENGNFIVETAQDYL
ncbi:DUF5694 domain-containing protein [Virgibacillus siamensis]|uniref:DUF5694 domain-containing protein n=1 Tax=Virgibacillus siamensis TaxID=480071 RepID=UPI0009878DFE|nr:DUF5694 domain-containing protein [Virgibacillus siamensis]